jgi:serine protease AprX
MAPIATVSRGRRRLIAATVAVFGLAAAAPGQAAHRARLSADLEDHLAAGSPSIDVIVHGTRVEVDGVAARYALRIKKYLKSGAVLQVTAGELALLQQDEAIDHLSGDIAYRSVADITAETIGADQVWAGSESVPALSGAGIGVAVIDSGVDALHAALRGHVAATVDFTGGNGADLFGHGTHVAAIIAGQIGRLADTSDYRGIAYAASIVNLRVLDAGGSGFASNVVQAIDWAIENRKAYNIKVMNLSLGAPVLQPYRDDPVCEAVERAVAAGIIVVVAAGNNGTNLEGQRVHGSITSPGNDPHAITVGALDTHGTAIRSDDTVANYSSRGPTLYDLVLKPDLVAPGSRVVSAEAAGSYLSTMFPQRHVAGAGADGYMQLSGTSMATGVVTGAVALLLEANSKLSARDAKAILQLTSSFMPGEGLVASGAGSLNIIAAAQLLSSAKPLSPVAHISDETVHSNGLAFVDRRVIAMIAGSVMSAQNGHDTIVWGLSHGDTIVWGLDQHDTIIWGLNGGDTIIWGLNEGDTIIWGLNHTDTIVWGPSGAID